MEFYDSDDVVELDISQITQDPTTLYEAANKIICKISNIKNHLEKIHKNS